MPSDDSRYCRPHRHQGLRRPDVMVECATLVPDTYEVREPKLVVEAASPSTTSIDQTRKVEEYKRHPTLAYILLVEPLKPQALLLARERDAWEIETFEGLEAVIALPVIGAALALADIYDGLSFPRRRDLAAEEPPL
ncbi:Uma2 family endonuclease [Methylobacterium sp. CM6241]